MLDRSTWVDYEAPAHGYAFKGPADWHSSYADPATSHEIIILRHPSSVSGCGLVYVPAAPGTTIDIESYIEYMTDSQVIEMASFKYSSVRLLYKKQGEVSGRTGLLTIFTGVRGGGGFLVMTLSTVRLNQLYEFQCIAAPDIIDEAVILFLMMAESLKITPD